MNISGKTNNDTFGKISETLTYKSPLLKYMNIRKLKITKQI